MVMRKRLNHGSNGFQVHSIPRAPRSIRRRSPQKKMVEDSQICAFELLASIAGQLLQESESSTSSNAAEITDHHAIGKNVIKQEQEEVKPVKAEYIKQATGEQTVLASDVASQNSDKKFVLSDALLAASSIHTSSGSSDKVNVNAGLKSEMYEIGNPISKVGVASPDYDESHIVNIGNGIERQQDTEDEGTGDMTMAHACSLKGSVNLREKLPDFINSDSYNKLPLSVDLAPSPPLALHRHNVSLCNIDDDETFSRHIKPIRKMKPSRPPSRIGDRRIRKLLTSKYWKVAPKMKDCEMSKTDGGVKSVYRKRKTYYHRESYQHDRLSQRRKLFHRSLVVTSDGGFSSESVSNSPEKPVNGDKNSSTTSYHGVSSKIIGHQTSFHHKDSHVKFSIKSFKVPELFIEVPETTTVGSLKRTVMEAVTAILGGGLRIGVVLQGKKVRDDNRTLLQTGISCTDNLDSLGFTLEPSAVQDPPPPICFEAPPLLSPCHAPPIATRSLPDSDLGVEISGALPGPKSLTTSVDHLESNHETMSCHTDISTDSSVSDSRALVPVPVPAMNMEAPLAVIPLNQKPRRSELAQRRTRRPFSVTEVEALVESVEQLGTGRWRDVKLRSFENADHRTYVDLKDKWKTLVHTAQIAPQQRRGEPVPQELLDRVLAAHGYWSNHQARQHGKHAQKITEPAQASNRTGAENALPTTTTV